MSSEHDIGPETFADKVFARHTAVPSAVAVHQNTPTRKTTNGFTNIVLYQEAKVEQPSNTLDGKTGTVARNVRIKVV